MSRLRMVFVASTWDRWLLVGLVAILGLSSGVASIAQGEATGVAAHTTFVSGIRFVDLPEQTALPPIEYGLATHRDTRLFGLWKIDRPVRESQDRMVFAWSSHAPDPREATALTPGDYARVRDRYGIEWTVYEFTYLSGAELHYAYGVRVGALHHTDDTSLGADGSYNYVLVYRPERLMQPEPAPGRAPDPEAATDAHLGEALDHGLEVDLGLPAQDAPPEGSESRSKPQLAFGIGDIPLALQIADPARAYRAAPSPPGIPSLPDP